MKKLKLGDSWTCKCGKKLILDGFWLAAHWDEKLRRDCDCGQRWNVRAGKVTAVRRGQS